MDVKIRKRRKDTNDLKINSIH